jgi:hypothetical protein
MELQCFQAAEQFLPLLEWTVCLLSLGLWSIANSTCLLGKTPLDWCRSAWFFIASSVVVLHFLTDDHPILVVFHQSNPIILLDPKVLIVCPAILQTLPPHFFVWQTYSTVNVWSFFLLAKC